MKMWLNLCFLSVAVCFSAASLHGQAIYAATESTRIQAGAGGMHLKTDYAGDVNNGISLWADVDFRAFLGLEVEGHLGGLAAPGGIGENSYLIGPRVRLHRRRITGYGKFMLGLGTITNQTLNQSSSFNVYAFGGGLEYRLSRKLNLRAVDVELQRWPSFPSYPLSPLAITIGASYIIR